MRQVLANAGNIGGTRSASAIEYVVIHYTGNDGDTADANARYYASTVVKTSAHYFVDAKEVVQSVPDLRVAWAVGGSKYASAAQTGGGKLHGKCTNANSISIEICDAVRDGVYKPAPETIAAALDLTHELMQKYGIPAERVIRHFDVTGKLCPAYWVNDAVWRAEFWSKLSVPDYYGALQQRAGLADGTMAYLRAYKYGDALIEKLATMK